MEVWLSIFGCRVGWPGLHHVLGSQLSPTDQDKDPGQVGSESVGSTDEKVGGGCLGDQEVRVLHTTDMISKSPKSLAHRKPAVPVCQVLSQREHCNPMSQETPQSQSYGLATS